VQVPLVEGSQRIALETVSLADEVVGADSLTITRSP
jgi:hypothetical protein